MDLSLLRGIIPPIITPFMENEEIDETVLRREVRLLLDAGVHGISFGGSTGEGAVLSDEELSRGVEIVQEETEKGFPLLCGIIRNSTREAVNAGMAAMKAGADALMVTPTFYFGTTDPGNYEFFKILTQEVGLPVVIYNVIQTNQISPASMAKISEIDLVVGIKQSVGGIHGLTDMIQVCGGKTLIFGAQDDLLFASYLLGAVGSISAILTAFPRECVQQWDAVQKGDIEKAKSIHYRILPVWRKIEGGAFPGRMKAVLNLLGRKVGKARSPILAPTAPEMKELENLLKKYGFIT